MPWGTEGSNDERAARHEPPARVVIFRLPYPTGGWMPQSGEPEPGAFVTWVKPVPSVFTV